MKRYKHPLHGWTHGYGPLDEARLLANGWVEDAPAPEVAPKPDPEPAPIPEPAKRGRPKKVQQ